MGTYLTSIVRESMIERRRKENKVYSHSLYLPHDVGERLDAYCRASGAKVSSVMARALELYLPRLERALDVLSDDSDSPVHIHDQSL
jgi:hypothetical protein